MNTTSSSNVNTETSITDFRSSMYYNDKLYLAPYVKAKWHDSSENSKGFFGSGYYQKSITDQLFWNDLVFIAALWIKPNTVNDVLDKVINSTPKNHISKQRFDRVFEFLYSNHFLIHLTSATADGRYSRHHLYYALHGANPQTVQKRLSLAQVIILGCGGIGNHIAHSLVTSGVNHVILVDNDRIELSNLSRQFLFTESDVGQYKVDILKTELLKRNSSTKISIIRSYTESESDLLKLPSADLIIISADHPSQIGSTINSFCVRSKTPYLMVGYINDIAVIGPFFIPDKTSCYNCKEFVFNSKPTSTPEEKAINQRFRPASFPAVNSVAAGYAFADVVKFLGGFSPPLSQNRRIGIHSLDAIMQIQSIPKNPACLECGTSTSKESSIIPTDSN